PLYNQMKSSSQALGTEVQFTTLNKALSLQKEPQSNLVSTSGGHRENWGESTVAKASPRTDTSTDDKNQR
ncbi:transcription factor TGA2.3-like isoform X2, partial [Fagus crenata]